MKTVLLAWELGAGTGHAVALRRYAARLRRHEVRLIAVVKNYVAAQGLLDLGVAILQAPPWPGHWLSSAQRQAGSSATMGDNLAECGLMNESAFTEVLRQWDEIVAVIRPDLVVGQYAPAAALVARRRTPLLLTGNGFTLPPSEIATFPLLHAFAPPRWDEAYILAAVNNAAKSSGAHPLDRLAQLFEADVRIVETFTLLDPYAPQRIEPVDGPALDHSPVPRRADAERIVVYLAPGAAIHPDIVDALRPFAPHVHIHALGLADAQRTELAKSGAHVRDQRFALSDELSHARLVVHLGGSGVASHAIAAGVPQLIIAGHIEQELNGQAVARAGLGRKIAGYDPAARITSDIIAGMLEDVALSRRAADTGAAHRALLDQAGFQNKGPLEKFERAALTLLGS